MYAIQFIGKYPRNHARPGSVTDPPQANQIRLNWAQRQPIGGLVIIPCLCQPNHANWLIKQSLPFHKCFRVFKTRNYLSNLFRVLCEMFRHLSRHAWHESIGVLKHGKIAGTPQLYTLRWVPQSGDLNGGSKIGWTNTVIHGTHVGLAVGEDGPWQVFFMVPLWWRGFSAAL